MVVGESKFLEKGVDLGPCHFRDNNHGASHEPRERAQRDPE